MRRSTTPCALGLATAAFAVIAAAPARATVHERIRSADHYTDAYDCGFPVKVAGTWSELVIIREGKNDDAEAFPVLNRFAYLVSRNRGALHVTYLFDTLGDCAPGGEFIADVDFRVAGPHPALELEPCDIATQLIG